MKITDLTFEIKEAMPVFKAHWHPAVEITMLGRHEIEGRQTRKIILGTHTGTHMDAPLHFIKGGASIDQLQLEIFAGKALIIKFPDAKAGREILSADIRGFWDEFPKIERVVFRYDWSDQWEKDCYYRDYPYLSMDAADFLVEKKVQLVGMDTPSPDNPKNGPRGLEDSPIHKLLLSKGIVLVEYLNNLRAIQSDLVDFFVFPLKLKGADGSPVRCLAFE